MRGYSTNKILALGRTESLLTTVCRGALVFSLPYIGVGLIVLLVTMFRMPVFGIAVMVLLAFYGPLYMMSRPSKVKIENGQVVWKPRRVVDRSLLVASFAQVIFFVVTICIWAAVRGN